MINIAQYAQSYTIISGFLLHIKTTQGAVSLYASVMNNRIENY